MNCLAERVKLPLLYCALAVSTVLAHGCTKARSLEEIEAEQRSLPALYLTEKSLTEVQAPADAGLFVDEATGEICYRAYECQNPDCPGRGADGTPHRFIHRDVLASLDAGGEVVWTQVPAGREPQEYIRSLGGYPEATCPKCAEKRDLAGESEENRAKYRKWIQFHELPQTVKRRAELEQEYQAAFEARQRVRQGE